MINVNLNLYRIFYITAQSKTIIEASEKLNISQPAVSKDIKNLENMLNIKLFNRNKKGISLTPEGEQLYENVDKAYNHIIAGQKLITDINNLSRGNLIIGVPSHITCFYLLDYLKEFSEKYPNIKIRLISMSTSMLTKKLYDHKVDFIIDTPPINLVGENVKKKKIAELETTFISSIKISKLSKDNIYKYNFILPYSNSPMVIKLNEILEENKLKIIPNYEVDTTDVIIASTKKGIGIGYVVKNAIKDELKSNQIYEVKFDFKLPKLELDLVYMKNYLTKSAKIFIKEFLEKDRCDKNEL